jgi:hypothetical protein
MRGLRDGGRMQRPGGCSCAHQQPGWRRSNAMRQSERDRQLRIWAAATAIYALEASHKTANAHCSNKYDDPADKLAPRGRNGDRREGVIGGTAADHDAQRKAASAACCAERAGRQCTTQENVMGRDTVIRSQRLFERQRRARTRASARGGMYLSV